MADRPAPVERPAGDVWSLGLLHAVWLVAIAVLLVACGWFEVVKQRHKDGCLSHL